MFCKKLATMPYAQARVRQDNHGNTELVSYNTSVIQIVDNWLYISGLYSRTTIKHISAFMREYTRFDYYTAKKLFQTNSKLNIITGEIESR